MSSIDLRVEGSCSEDQMQFKLDECYLIVYSCSEDLIEGDRFEIINVEGFENSVGIA